MNSIRLIVASVAALGISGCFDSTCEGTYDIFQGFFPIFERSADLSKVKSKADLAAQIGAAHADCLQILQGSAQQIIGHIETIGWDGVTYDDTFWVCQAGSCQVVTP